MLRPMEIVERCPLCGGLDHRRLYEGRDARYGTDDVRFGVHQCLGCGLGFTSPRPGRDEIGRYYPSVYYAGRGERGADSGEVPSDAGFRERIRRVREICPAGDVVEVGCANGDFLRALRELGYGVRGVEPEPGAAEYCRSRYGIDVVTATGEQAVLPEESADLVVAWEVIEHFHDPKVAVSRWKSWLRPGGAVLLSTPNLNSPNLRWLHRYDIPRHLFHFSPAALRRLAADQGFRVRYIHQRTKIQDGSLRGAAIIALRKAGLRRDLAERPWVRALDEWVIGKPSRSMLPLIAKNGTIVACLRRS